MDLNRVWMMLLLFSCFAGFFGVMTLMLHAWTKVLGDLEK